MISIKSIIFYFPHHQVGGVSTLFLRISEAISSNYTVYVVDYSDGFMARNLPEKVQLIRIDKEDTYPSNSIFVFQSFLPWRLPCIKKIDDSSRLLFWNLHPNNFDPSVFNENSEFLPWRLISKGINALAHRRKRKVREIVQDLIGNRALVFMDRENVRQTEEFIGCNLAISDYLPVGSPKLVKRRGYEVKNDCIKLAWVGRLADFKYRSIEHLILRLNTMDDLNCRIILSIIGDGEFRGLLEAMIAKLDLVNLEVIFLGELSSIDLHEYLRGNIDITFAMGTSSLEAASIGIPVFLVDYSFTKILEKYKFKLIYDNTDYCLGEKITFKSYESKCTLSKAIKEVLDNYDVESEKCYKYWEENFSIESISKKLVDQCNSTTATFGAFNEKKYFTSDSFGHLLRSIGWIVRGRSSKKIVGFRNDC